MGRKWLYYVLGGAIVSALLIFPLLWGAGGITKGSQAHSENNFTKADEFLFQNLFALREEADYQGNVNLKLRAGCKPWIQFDPNNADQAPLYRFYYRQGQMVYQHIDLYKTDQEYRQAFDKHEARAIHELSGVDRRTGRQTIYPWLRDAGIYQKILARIGPSVISEVPAGVEFDQWGRSTDDFVYGRSICRQRE